MIVAPPAKSLYCVVAAESALGELKGGRVSWELVAASGSGPLNCASGFVSLLFSKPARVVKSYSKTASL